MRVLAAIHGTCHLINVYTPDRQQEAFLGRALIHWVGGTGVHLFIGCDLSTFWAPRLDRAAQYFQSAEAMSKKVMNKFTQPDLPGATLPPEETCLEPGGTLPSERTCLEPGGALHPEGIFLELGGTLHPEETCPDPGRALHPEAACPDPGGTLNPEGTCLEVSYTQRRPSWSLEPRCTRGDLPRPRGALHPEGTCLEPGEGKE
ncbi:hypothetical protein NDU88_007827 [Pleurodeles waltl]|uniref:Uncharacterized protein n=1 Tax=Pleurodeles waltl TaxID=8319 RepID=A0AAV7LVM7_PLEWA|nr:hypothetical protein NDU88_007827 [Pleurodeles waltl]